MRPLRPKVFIVVTAVLVGSGAALADEDVPVAEAAKTYDAWLKDMKLSPAIELKGREQIGGIQHIYFGSGEALPELLDEAHGGGEDSLRRLYVKYLHVAGISPRATVLHLNGNAPCDWQTVSFGTNGRIAVEGDQCRTSEKIVLSPKLVERLVRGAPKGNLALRWQEKLVDRARSFLTTWFHDKGAIRVLASEAQYLQIEVSGMNGEILRDEGWWEMLQLSLWVEPAPEPIRKASGARPATAATLRWQASGRFGAGIGRPPKGPDGYGSDFEPAHSRDLTDYVSAMLVKMKDGFAGGP